MRYDLLPGKNGLLKDQHNRMEHPGALLFVMPSVGANGHSLAGSGV